MSTLLKSGDPIVDAALSPLAGLFRPGVQEITANRPEEMLLEMVGKGWKTEKVRSLDLKAWKNINRVLANWTGADYDPIRMPTVSCKLPGGHRYEGMIGRGPEREVSVSIRVLRTVRFSLSDFGVPPAAAERIHSLVAGGANFLVSGGTSSGKTSLFRAVASAVPSTERIIALEDPPELDLDRFPNHNRFVPQRHGGGLSQSDFLDHFMRIRPDRIWVGELSMKNVSAALQAMSTGHKGFGLTIHANSAWEALESGFAKRLMFDKQMGGIQPERLFAELRQTFDLVIQIEHRPEGRRVVEIWEPAIQDRPTRLLPALLGGH